MMITVIFLIMLIASGKTFSENLSVRTKIIMGTYITIKIPESKEKLLENAFNIFKELDSKLSIYKENSEISFLNKNKKAVLSKKTLNIIKRSIEICRETNGYFDITVGKVTSDLYRFGFDNERIPDEKSLKKSVRRYPCTGIKFQGSRVVIDKDTKIDLGGIGKGYAVDLVYGFFKKNGIKRGVILASGDIRCVHRCTIYVKDPFGEGYILRFKTRVKGAAVSTSGTYERFIKSSKFNHLINPKTGKSQENIVSATLIWNGNNTELDGYATAVSVMPIEKALKFLKTKDIGYIIILNSKEVFVSENIARFVEDLNFIRSDINIVKKQ